MKKVISITFLMMVLIPFGSAFAATLPANYVDVLRGKQFKAGATVTTVFTDGDTSTGTTMAGAWSYTFPEPVDIAGYSTYGVNGIYGSTTRVAVSHVAGTTVLSSNSGDSYVELHLKGVTGVTLQRVGTEGGPGTFYDIKMYVDPTANPDASKFVISNLKAEQSGMDGVLLNWDAVESAYLTGYRLYMNGASYGDVLKTNSTRVPGLSLGQTYTFKVVPIDRGGHEYPGATVSHQMIEPDTTPPDKIPKLTVDPDLFKAIATWDESKADDLDGYRVYLDGKGASGWIKTNRFTLENLKPGTTYQLYVVARDTSGNISEPSSIMNFKTKALVTDTEQEAKEDYLLVNWQKTDEAVGYRIYLNGRLISSVGPTVFKFKITRAMGYIPGAISNKAEARAILADGSEGGSNNPTAPVLELGAGYGVGDAFRAGIEFVKLFNGWVLIVLAIALANMIIAFLYLLNKKYKITQRG
ncbi:fibronectin type III domain-containing protein [Paenibacillus polymyxa]|uniref:fibronectin type III domain-containing protein n=1 Tax=Paenibacillus polymyxa TaxID=1406 RepID=UPI002ED18A38|nr:fibronectin type III domain-containing protein [Paenibacillus polymyxa]